MSRDPQLLLDDILDSAASIRAYIAAVDAEGFAADDLRFDAVVRRFEVIGEAVKRLPSELTGREPQVPWRAIAGFRDVLAHAYFEIDSSVVWNSATVHLPVLVAACERLKRPNAANGGMSSSG